MNEITNTELDVQIPELWLELQDIIMPLYSKTRIPMRVRRFDEQAKFYGDIVHVTQFPTMTVAAVGADGTLSNQASTPTEVQMSINQWRGNQITLLNRAAKQANIDAVKAYAESMKGAVLNDVEDVLLQNVADLTGTPSGDGVTPLTGQILLAAVQYALNAEMGYHLEDPERASFFLPANQYSALQMEKIISEFQITGAPGGAEQKVSIERRIWGIPAFFSTRVHDTTYAGNNIYLGCLAAREALSLAIQKEMGIQEIASTGLSRTFAVDVLFGSDASILARGFPIRAPR